MIRYTDPASVEKIMDMIGTKGVLNSPEGLNIFRDERGDCPKIMKGQWVDFVDGKVRVYRTDLEAATAHVLAVRGGYDAQMQPCVDAVLERMKKRGHTAP